MRLIDRIFAVEFKIGKHKITCFELLFFMIMSSLGLALRLYLYDFESSDYTNFLKNWMQECRLAGGWPYVSITPLETDASTLNYNVMFQYCLILMYYIGGKGIVNDLYILKTFSVIFDYICAVTIMRIAFHVTGGDKRKSIFSYAVIMFLPTIVLNSAAWAQDDSVYAAFALLAILHFLKGNDLRAFIYFALSYSFKQQAIFILPLVIILWLKNKVKIRYFLAVPVVLALTLIPAALSGRKLTELLSIYFNQATQYTRLTMNYPSIYAMVYKELDRGIRLMLIPAGVVTTIMIFGALAYYIYLKSFKITGLYTITLAIFTVEVACFCLPVMHERYGYISEILAVVYALFGYKRFPVCVALQVISMVTYTRFLFGSTITEIWPLSAARLCIIIFIGYDLYKQMRRSR